MPDQPSTSIKSYRDLHVWQRAMELAEAIYRITRDLPSSERFRLVDQLVRAAVSVPANIAEGFGREGRKDYARFLGMAKGSAFEVETHLLLAVRIGMITEEGSQHALGLCSEVTRMLNAMRRRLSVPPTRP